jgi:outer membrane protein OmpA-like peptidoglycan-associated protein
VQQAAQQVPAAGQGVLDSLMHPEGDHIGFGISFSGDAAAGVGIQGNVGAMFDVVFDYRRNDIGFFLSPNAGLQVNSLDASLTAGLGGAGAWGTVASFGDPNKDVLEDFGGWFTNVSYGVQGKLAVEGGFQVATGGSFYRGGSTDVNIPLPGSHTVPGTPGTSTTTPGTTTTTPGTPGGTSTTPGTPDTPVTTPLGDVPFPTQGDSPDPGAVTAAADRAHTLPGLVGIDVTGHTSRGWRHLPAGMSREQANQALSDRRGSHVAGALTPLVPPTPVASSGAGDSLAAAAGKAENDLSASDQHATITAHGIMPGTPASTSTTPGTPGTTTTTPGTTTTTPGTPAQQVPNGVAIPLPNPFQAKQAWGWDTTVSAAGLAGAAGAAGVYGGAGLSYSIPLGKTHLSHDTMQQIRAAVGFFKLLGDIMSVSPLGFIRDLFGVAQPVAADGATAIGGAATSWSMPAPAA